MNLSRFRPSAQSLEKRELLSVSTTLLAEFNSGDTSASFSDFDTSGDVLYFDVNESELWRTDGTQSGTLKLADVNRTEDVIEAGRLALFNVTSEDDNSIWRTDGTADGTFELLPNATVYQAVAVGESLFFSSSEGLHRSDGTPRGTELVTTDRAASLVATSDTVFYRDIESSISFINGDGAPQQLKIPGGWFEAAKPGDPDRQLQWLQPREAPELFVANDKVVFITAESRHFRKETEVIAWASDGTQDGTQVLTTRQGNRENNLVFAHDGAQLGDQLIVPFSQGTFLSTDGTLEGTRVMEHGRSTYGENSSFLAEQNGRVYFELFEVPTTDIPAPIFSTDGNSFRQETPSFHSSMLINDRSISIISAANTNEPYFTQHEAFVIDETGLTQLEPPTTLGPVSFLTAANVGSTWYVKGFDYPPRHPDSGPIAFQVTDEQISTELPFTLGDLLLQGTTNYIHEGETWWSSQKPHHAPLFMYEAFALYALDGGASRQLITELPNDPPMLGPSPFSFGTDKGGALYHYDTSGLFYFTKTTAEFGQEIWVSDGTAEGTDVVDLAPGPVSSSPTLYNWNGRTFVTTSTPENRTQVWVIDAEQLPVDTIPSPEFQTDANGNGRVDFGDFLILSSNFGKRDVDFAFADGDFNNDQAVDFADFLLIAADFAHRDEV